MSAAIHFTNQLRSTIKRDIFIDYQAIEDGKTVPGVPFYPPEGRGMNTKVLAVLPPEPTWADLYLNYRALCPVTSAKMYSIVYWNYDLQTSITLASYFCRKVRILAYHKANNSAMTKLQSLLPALNWLFMTTREAGKPLKQQVQDFLDLPCYEDVKLKSSELQAK